MTMMITMMATAMAQHPDNPCLKTGSASLSPLLIFIPQHHRPFQSPLLTTTPFPVECTVGVMSKIYNILLLIFLLFILR